jgi:hypothetical protein
VAVRTYRTQAIFRKLGDRATYCISERRWRSRLAMAMAVADFNGDRIPDLAVGCYSPYPTSTVSILLGAGQVPYPLPGRIETVYSMALATAKSSWSPPLKACG